MSLIDVILINVGQSRGRQCDSRSRGRNRNVKMVTGWSDSLARWGPVAMRYGQPLGVGKDKEIEPGEETHYC